MHTLGKLVYKYLNVLQQNHEKKLFLMIQESLLSFWESLESVWQQHGSAFTEWLGDSAGVCAAFRHTERPCVLKLDGVGPVDNRPSPD